MGDVSLAHVGICMREYDNALRYKNSLFTAFLTLPSR